MQNILENPELLDKFEEYCNKKYCSENLTFWKGVQEFKQIDEIVLRNLRAKALVDKYIIEGSALQINLDSHMVNPILEAIEQGNTTLDLFNDAEKHVLLLMEMDVLPGFLLSGSTKKKVDVENQNSSSNSDVIEVVGEWNHTNTPTDSRFAKKLGKELVMLDFTKHHVGIDSIRAEEENNRLDAWCCILEKETEANKKQIHRLQKTAMQLLSDIEYLKGREIKLQKVLEKSKETINSIANSSDF